ncbi:DMT family transporter [Clostridium ganghwense]|uniref:DMT family transporter n=1 Tax=Clostridium ganghwense TaxID=312089 RepID=A0ABT4CP30_9CLOT|nr:DMT family transporter [Clostridium ganghwense]MCY6370802.1 DMT family transporter [Clostridium ganghwense]
MKYIDKKKSIMADMALLLVAIVWGGGFVATKDALNNVPPFYITAMRFMIATLLLCIVFWKKIRLITKNDIKAGSVVGIFLFGGFATQTVGLQYTTPGKQAFITATYVVIVPFLAWIINKKRPDIYSIIAAFLTLIGIGMLSLQNSLHIGLGDSLTLLCAVFFAVQIVAIGFYTEDVDPVILTIVQLAVCGLLSAICGFIFEPFPKQIGTQSIMSILYLGLFSTMLGIIVQNVAQKYTSETHAAIILSLESLFGCILSVILLGELFTTKMILGCIFIFIAVITSETKWEFLKPKQKKNSTAA